LGSPDLPNLVAVDVGGTSVRAVAVGPDRRHSEVIQVATPRSGEARSVVDAIVDAVTALAVPSDCQVCVGLPGVGVGRGDDPLAVNLPGHGQGVLPALEQVFSGRLHVFHDVHAALEAERIDGALQGVKDGALVSLGTGIGAGLVVDGRPVRGDGFAGELGHMHVGTGLDCACGAKGCLETVASGPAIERAYRARGGASLRASQVLALALDGDDQAREVVEPALAGLCQALQALVALLAPERVVFVGGVASDGGRLLGALSARLEASLSFHRRPELVLGVHEGQASLWGLVRLGQGAVERSSPGH